MSDRQRWLVSEETGEDFSHCLCCALPLVEIAAPWLVNQEFYRGECVREYAICLPCRDQVTAQISEESKKSVRNFLEREIDWEERVREFMLSSEVAERFAACIVCRVPRGELDGFGISALFDGGGKLVNGPLPLLICCPCSARMTAEMSDASRAVWKAFLEENFAGPADDCGLGGLL
jgi:hypothetical protein